MRKYSYLLVLLFFANCSNKNKDWEIYYPQNEIKGKIVDSLKKKLPDSLGKCYTRLFTDSNFAAADLCIISGGQTGVEQAALAVARDLKIKACGWCIPHKKCDTGYINPQFLMFETPKECSNNAPAVERSLRLEWNVIVSDATLILRNDVIKKMGASSIWNVKCAQRYHKEYAVLDIRDTANIQNQIKLWHHSHKKKIRILNIVGAKETDYKKAPIYNGVYHILHNVFSELLKSNEYTSYEN